jgi:GH24 family phage-related lysozyme (muramidase)
MNLSRRGVRLIQDYEGFRSRPYRDSVGVWTVGYGSTKGVGPHTAPLNRAQASERLRSEVDAEYGAAVKALHLPLNQHQFDALVSFVYNVGPGALGPELRARHWRRAADELLRWDKAGGRPLLGLTRRRRAERKLFLTPPP